MAQGIHEPATPIPDDGQPDRLRRVGVEVVYTGDRPTVTVTGGVDRATIIEVSGTVRGLIAVGVSELVVDLDRRLGRRRAAHGPRPHPR
jgi:hypothetical protein